MERKDARIARNGFRQITASLRAGIEVGEIEAGSYLPTERELQSRFGASRSTVRKALAALVELGWARSVPNRGVIASRGFKRTGASKIALIDGGSYVLKVLGVRLGELLQQRGFDLVQLGGSVEYPIEYALQRAMDQEYEGAIVWPYRGFLDADLLERACRQLPIVALDHRLDGADTDLVTFDHEAAAFVATETLIRNGAKRIGVTGMFDMLEITHQRFRGYMRAMFAHGLQPLARDYIFTATSGQNEADTTKLEECLASENRPDGFFVLADSHVPATIECALRAGLSLPADLKVATIGDDIDVSVDGVGLTAAALDWEALTLQALNLLLDRLENLHRPPQVRLAPHRLVVRGLCGAPREEWTPAPELVTGFRGQLPLPKSQYRYTSRWSVGKPEPQPS